MEFIEFPKIPRYSREVIVTEKIDGTNACICITPEEFLTGNRTRWITPDDDNFGFSRWAHENQAELMKLGEGTHYGEWWGSGIQRGYGLKEKRFSLFNVSRWCVAGETPARIKTADPRIEKYQEALPACCGLVPVLWGGKFDELDTGLIIAHLINVGSLAAPGFKRPEGIVIFHVAGNVGFKKTIEKDEQPKGAR